MGQTVDDAAGEAFDKFAKMLRLGFPGGVRVDRAASTGDPRAFQFPRGLWHEDNLNFSFSGLKTAGLRAIEALPPERLEKSTADLCASYQEAIVDVLLEKLLRASRREGIGRWAITGGVSANSRLRARAEALAAQEGALLALPPPRYCTDNAAMIALAGLYRLRAGETSPQDLSPAASSRTDDWSLA
jgi:N6-L-threonylcarbamoyladenine synthase